jgi:hypothetical protein
MVLSLSEHGFLTLLVEELLCFIDLRSEIRAAASIGVVAQHQGAVRLADLVLARCSFIEVEDQGGLLLGHLGLEAALVEGLAHGADAAAGATPCDESSTAQEGGDCGASTVSDDGRHFEKMDVGASRWSSDVWIMLVATPGSDRNSQVLKVEALAQKM